MKKKILSLVLVAAMVMGLSMTAMAAPGRTDVKKGIGSYTNNVDIKIQDPAPNDVYAVDVKWESLDFTYNFGTAATWNPDEHEYSGTTGAKWDKTTAKITITNHSNVPVVAQTGFGNGTATESQELYGVSAKITGGSKTLATGDGRTYAGADFVEATVTLEGVPTTRTPYTLDTVKVNISAVEKVNP